MTKHYRHSDKSIEYVTTSLTLDTNLVEFIEKEMALREEKNMSKFIEENVNTGDKFDIEKKRKQKTFPVKKTFTFTKDFVEKIKPSGNMSLFIESSLIKTFEL